MVGEKWSSEISLSSSPAAARARPRPCVVSSCPVCSVRSRVIRGGGLLLPLMAVRELDPADRQRELLLGVPADLHHLLVPLARTRA